jgi:hypothetical protein
MVKSRLFLGLMLMGAASELTQAHHFLVASYDIQRNVSVEGKVVQFLFRKPHSFVQVEILDQARHPEILLAEWGDGSQLSRAGVFQDSLKRGDHVVITGNPARNPAEHKLRIVSVVRQSDGWYWKEK